MRHLSFLLIGLVLMTSPLHAQLSEAVVGERHKLTTQKPDRWTGGTHLDVPFAGGTPLPGCLVPGSVMVKLPNGTVAERDKDYLLDEEWAGLSRIERGRIGEKDEVFINYRIGRMRLDTIAINKSGAVTILTGEPSINTPKPPMLPPGQIAVANVFLPYHTADIAPWQVFPIGQPFAEPDDAEMRRRAELVPKTLAKLRAGEPVTIVTWGDSVTSGGDASSPDKAFAQLFPARLRERFPKSKITHVNAGIGGTNTEGRFPGLKPDVLDHHPDLVTIEFVNDMGMPEEPLRKRYAEIFKQIRDSGAEIILITPHFVMTQWMGLPHPRGGETRRTVEVLRELATEHKVALADTSKRWAHLEADGIPYITLLVNGINHPDDRGHEMFVKDLLTFFPAK